MNYLSSARRVKLWQSLLPHWQQSVIGHSELGQAIIAFHQTPLDQCEVLAWSLMHGNETTGAEALTALIQQPQFGHKSWCIVPVLNPDGADAFTRLNHNGKDVNRDAIRSETKEGQALLSLMPRIQPKLVLNLHDQRSCFRGIGSDRPATFSLLAPCSNPKHEGGFDLEASKVASWMANRISQQHPRWGLARFNDSHYPNAFGDLWQSHAPTITLETGITLSDWTRGETAQALALLLVNIDSTSWEEIFQNPPDDYLALPMNAPLAARLAWRTCSVMWYSAGDRSADWNYYTKRGLLVSVYSTTLLYWMSDEGDEDGCFPDTLAFLDRRISDVLKTFGVPYQLKSMLSRFPNPFTLRARL